MAKIKIKFNPLFMIYVFLCVYFGWFNNVFYYIVVATLHEYGHLFVAKLLGYRVDGFIYSLYGVGLKTNNAYKTKDDILVSLAGPCVNLILIVVSICLWWIFPTTYFFTYDFVICNIVIMLFNLIPIYPLDGGRVMLALFSKKYSEKKILRFNNIVCAILGIILSVLFIVSLFFKINFSLLFMGFFLLLNSTINDSGTYFKRILAYNKKLDKPMEIKKFKVQDLCKSKLIKYLSPHYYSIFECEVDGKKEILEEKDIIFT